MAIKLLFAIIGAFTVAMMVANPVWAVQSHAGIEGLVVHQIGHILFAMGMGYLLFRIRGFQLKNRGWPQFKVFLWLIIAWNCLTFSGHWLNEFISAEKFIKSGGNIIAFSIVDFADAYFYFTRLDHLLLVPAFIFLLSALRKWRMS